MMPCHGSGAGLWRRILTRCLPLRFPEADRFHRSSRTDRFPALPGMFPSSRMILARPKDAFNKAAGERVGRKGKRSLLLPDIHQTEGICQGCLSRRIETPFGMFRLRLAKGRRLIRQRNALEDRALNCWPGAPIICCRAPSRGADRSTRRASWPGRAPCGASPRHRQFLKVCGMEVAPVPSMFRGRHVPWQE